jgi:hypothetical protein
VQNADKVWQIGFVGAFEAFAKLLSGHGLRQGTTKFVP